MKLGITAKDKITGFTGILTGRAEYITGCTQYLVQPPLNKEGAFVDAHWIDVDRLEEVVKEPVLLPRTASGFDVAAPIR